MQTLKKKLLLINIENHHCVLTAIFLIDMIDTKFENFEFEITAIVLMKVGSFVLGIFMQHWQEERLYFQFG